MSIVPPSNWPWNARPPNLATVACHEQHAPKPRVASLKLSWVLVSQIPRPMQWLTTNHSINKYIISKIHKHIYYAAPILSMCDISQIWVLWRINVGTRSLPAASRRMKRCYIDQNALLSWWKSITKRWYYIRRPLAVRGSAPRSYVL